MASLASGNREALATLFARHHQNVYALCVRLCGSEAAGEDVTQDVFLRVLKNARTFSGRSAFATWLYRITRNACLDFLRADRRESGKRMRYATETTATETTETAEDRETTEAIDRIRAALGQLEPEKREILVLRRYHGLSYGEIAEVCSCTVETARVRFHRALQSLRKLYMQSHSGPSGSIEVVNEM